MFSSLNAIEIHNVDVLVKMQYFGDNDKEKSVRTVIKDTVFIFLTCGWSQPHMRNPQRQELAAQTSKHVISWSLCSRSHIAQVDLKFTG